MTAILTYLYIDLAFLVALLVTRFIIALISRGQKNRIVSVMMFSSLDEATLAARIGPSEPSNSRLVTEPRYLADIDRYFVVIEEAPARQHVPV
jgi:hypothetical protein